MDYAIILGGGKGLRMGADVPKQFIEVGGLPILMRTIKRFREYDSWARSNHNSQLSTLNSKSSSYYQRISRTIGTSSARSIISPKTTR